MQALSEPSSTSQEKETRWLGSDLEGGELIFVDLLEPLEVTDVPFVRDSETGRARRDLS